MFHQMLQAIEHRQTLFIGTFTFFFCLGIGLQMALATRSSHIAANRSHVIVGDSVDPFLIGLSALDPNILHTSPETRTYFCRRFQDRSSGAEDVWLEVRDANDELVDSSPVITVAIEDGRTVSSPPPHSGNTVQLGSPNVIAWLLGSLLTALACTLIADRRR